VAVPGWLKWLAVKLQKYLMTSMPGGVSAYKPVAGGRGKYLLCETVKYQY
jgi:hypothetical protein